MLHHGSLFRKSKEDIGTIFNTSYSSKVPVRFSSYDCLIYEHVKMLPGLPPAEVHHSMLPVTDAMMAEGVPVEGTGQDCRRSKIRDKV